MAIALLLQSTPVAAEWHSSTEAIMGTRVHAEIWNEDAQAAQGALAAVMTEMRRIDELMSPYKNDSELSRLNQSGYAQPTTVSRELFELLQRSNQISELSDGAFDITYASAGRFYDYREGKKPSDAQLAKTIRAIDYGHLQLDASRYTVRYTHEGVYVDLGGIAKGYAVDRCIELLLARGINQAMVSAGGDSRILGDRLGQPWSVGIKDPRSDAMIAVLPLENTAVSTSGDYERFFIEDGVRYHHIIDPGTGESSYASRSVTVLGSEATFTDALATSVFILGVSKGLALINRLSGIDAVIIDDDGKLHFSDDLLQVSD